MRSSRTRSASVGRGETFTRLVLVADAGLGVVEAVALEVTEAAREPDPGGLDGAEVVAASGSTAEIIDKMLAKHPDRGNPYTLWVAAQGQLQ